MELSDKYEIIRKACLDEKSSSPIEIAKKLMKLQGISMHGPEHHFLDGACLLTAIKNSGVDLDLEKCLDVLANRTIKMPGAMCGYWGVCGSSTAMGSVLSIINETTPLSDNDYYKDNMELTSQIIATMSKLGGPRCCKRNAFISLLTTTKFVENKYNIHLEKGDTRCEFSSMNSQCTKEKCPFYIKIMK